MSCVLYQHSTFTAVLFLPSVKPSSKGILNAAFWIFLEHLRFLLPATEGQVSKAHWMVQYKVDACTCVGDDELMGIKRIFHFEFNTSVEHMCNSRPTDTSRI